MPWYSPSSVSGGSMSISSSSSCDGSSSTTMARFFIASRKRRGIVASASATSRSNFFRSTRDADAGTLVDDSRVVIAIVPDRALIAQRLWLADPASVQDERVGGARPPLFGQRAGELPLDDLRLVRIREADPVRHAQHVAIDRKSRDAE